MNLSVFVSMVLGSEGAKGISLRLRVAEVEDRVVGAVLSRWAYDRLGPSDTVFKDVGLIDAVAVVPGMRRRGVGQALVQDAEACFRRLGSRVVYAESTSGAAGFYESLRYRVEPVEVQAVSFFPRQGERLYTHCVAPLQGSRLVWRSLTGGKTVSSLYEHPEASGPGVAVTGLVPGDARRTAPWPPATAEGIRKVEAL